MFNLYRLSRKGVRLLLAHSLKRIWLFLQLRYSQYAIGRELYTSPFIWIPADKCRIENGKCCDKFSVKEIVIENKVIVGLSVLNGNNVVFTFGKHGRQAEEKQSPRDVFMNVLKARGMDPKQAAAQYGLNKDTPAERYIEILAEMGAPYNG